jgi:hypothetical protein
LLEVIAYAVLALAVVGAVSTWKRVSWRPAIVYAAGFVLYKVFVVGIGYNEWYGPPAIAVIFLLAAAGLQRLAGARTVLVAIPATALALAYAIHIPFSFPLERTIQHGIEDQVRLPMGRYLGEVAQTGQTMVSESAGYVSYYTNADLYDFPGLTSPAAVEALQRPVPHLLGVYGITQLLHPDFLILRPGEVDLLSKADPETFAQYRLLRTFSVPQADTELDQWGLSFFDFDREFSVYQRRPDAGSS